MHPRIFDDVCENRGPPSKPSRTSPDEILPNGTCPSQTCRSPRSPRCSVIASSQPSARSCRRWFDMTPREERARFSSVPRFHATDGHEARSEAGRLGPGRRGRGAALLSITRCNLRGCGTRTHDLSRVKAIGTAAYDQSICSLTCTTNLHRLRSFRILFRPLTDGDGRKYPFHRGAMHLRQPRGMGGGGMTRHTPSTRQQRSSRA